MSLQREAFESARKAALPSMRKKALEELIDEKLKLQEAKTQSVTIDDSEIDRVLAGIAERNKMTSRPIHKADWWQPRSDEEPHSRALSWNEVVKRRFGPLINVNTRDVDKLVAEATVASAGRCRVAAPARQDHAAEKDGRARHRAAHRGSGKNPVAIPELQIDRRRRQQEIQAPNSSNSGRRQSSTIPEPTRTLLLNASDGEMLPPTVGDGAVEL